MSGLALEWFSCLTLTDRHNIQSAVRHLQRISEGVISWNEGELNFSLADQSLCRRILSNTSCVFLESYPSFL